MDWICGCLRWKVKVEGHLAAHGLGIVGELQQSSSKRSNGSFGGDRHSPRIIEATDCKYERGPVRGANRFVLPLYLCFQRFSPIAPMSEE
jgi:hypothetical protein